MTKEQRRFVKFALVGSSGVLVNLGVVWAVGALSVSGSDASARFAIFCGIAVSIFTNFVINDAWTWADRAKGGKRHWIGRCGLFYATNGVAAGLQYAVSVTAFSVLSFESFPLGLDPATMTPIVASCVGIAVATPLNYVVNNLLTFRDKSA